MVANMGRANAVMQEIEYGAVGTINCLKSAFGPRPSLVREMRNIEVSVLQPSVSYKPHIDYKIWKSVEAKYAEP